MPQLDDRIMQGTLRTVGGRPLPLERTDVTARVTGPVAAVELAQVFRNDTGGPIEAVYLFPLPHEASVHTMRFRIGERVVEATVKEKEEARRTYEAARREGRSATLLEQDRPSLFSLSVANILPGERIEVTLGYQEKLAYDDGEWRFVFPMVTAERYHADKPAGDGAPRIRPPSPASNERRADVHVDVEVRSAEAPRSPSHRVIVESISGGGYRARLAAGAGSIANRDFVLAWRAGPEGVRAATYFERKPDAIGTFLLVVTPPVAPPPDQIAAASLGGAAGEAAPLLCGNCGAALRDPGAVRDVPGIGPAFRCAYCGAVLAASPDRKGAKIGLPRDVVFLVDRSCSMRGASLPQARRAVRFILEGLGDDDAVQLFAFDHDRVAFDEHGDGWVPRSAATIEQIDAFLAGLVARGGTELEEALERAAKLAVRKSRTRLVVLVTDAAVGNEGRLLRRAPEILGTSTRLYVLGVGPAVNRYLVERLARAGGGASDVLLPTEDLEAVMPRFVRRVRQAGPVLTGLKLTWDDALPADVYPSPIPELFGGQTVQLLGRFAGTGASRLVLTGTKANGEPFRQEVDVALPEQADMIPGLERLWARLRVDARLERLARAPGEAAEIRLEVLGLALKHKLLSPYTSLVAEDSETRVEGPAKRVEMEAGLMSEGAPAEDVFFSSKELASMEADGAARECTRAGVLRGKARRVAMEEDLDSLGFGSPMASALMDDDELDVRTIVHAGSAPMASPARGEAPAMARSGGVLSKIIGFFTGSGEPEEAPRESAPPPPPPLAAPSPGPSARIAGSDEYTAEMLAYAKQKGAGELDLVFLVDETGSMGAYIEEVKRRLLEIIEALRAAPLCRSLRIGLVSYRDHPPQDHTFASRVAPLTDDLAAIKEGVARMQASGGGDGPESVTDGLYDLVRLEWRPRAARVVVWVGDAPPHGVEPHNDGFPQGCPCGHHWYAQAESAREMGVVIHAVGCLPTLRSYAGAEEVFRTVARTTRGLYLPLSEAPLLIPLITGVAETELDKQRIEERIAEALARYQAELQPADDQERVRFVRDVLQEQGVRPRGMVYDPNQPGAGPLRFREISLEDIEEGLERLRRTGRTSL